MAFSRADLDDYIAGHRLGRDSADYLRLAAAGLARNVGNSGFTSLKTEYQSRKMGAAVNTESRTGELSYAIHLDFDPDVVGFYEQPPQVDCYRATKAGTRRLTNYTPDMLVLHVRGPFVAQVKPKAALDALVAKSADWTVLDGVYRDAPADEALARVGLPHQIICSSDLSQQRTSNLALLLRSLDVVTHDPAFAAASLSLLNKSGPTSLGALARTLGIVDLTPLLALLARGSLFTDLSRFALTRPDACLITDDPALLVEAVYGTWQEMCRDPTQQMSGQADLRQLPLARHLKRGVAIVEQLARGAKGRSARRWQAKIREGAATVVRV